MSSRQQESSIQEELQLNNDTRSRATQTVRIKGRAFIAQLLACHCEAESNQSCPERRDNNEPSKIWVHLKDALRNFAPECHLKWKHVDPTPSDWCALLSEHSLQTGELTNHKQLKAHTDESKGHSLETLHLIGKCAISDDRKDSIITKMLVTQTGQVWCPLEHHGHMLRPMLDVIHANCTKTIHLGHKSGGHTNCSTSEHTGNFYMDILSCSACPLSLILLSDLMDDMEWERDGGVFFLRTHWAGAFLFFLFSSSLGKVSCEGGTALSSLLGAAPGGTAKRWFLSEAASVQARLAQEAKGKAAEEARLAKQAREQTEEET